MAKRGTTSPVSTVEARVRLVASRDVRQALEAILRVVELNTRRISRLEDVFAIHLREREEVSNALEQAHALLQDRPLRSSPKRRPKGRV